MRMYLPLLAVLASACSFSAAQTARTNGKGNVQVGLEPGAAIGIAGGAAGAIPNLDVAVRYGVSDKVDIGGRLGSAGLELQTKFQLTPDDGTIVSLAPRVSAFALGVVGAGATYVSVPVPVLIDIPVGESALVLGPGITTTYLGTSASSGGSSASASVLFLSANASVGYAAKLSDGFRLMPEVGIIAPLVGTASASSSGDAEASASFNAGGVLTSVKLNFLLGKTK